MSLEFGSHLLGRYRIDDELGRGGMGAVYRGYDENLNVEVAIKENLFVSPESERQFKREASLLASLRHPHLPRVTDHFVIEGQGQYLVMDFIPGDDAKTYLEKNNGPLPEAQVLQWAQEILSALDYLHNRPQPVVHRDIKPGNIKITPEGKAVLVDFGLAKKQESGATTTMGAKAFTPGYAPPEQYGMGRTDARTDLYSLGATLYNLLTNALPADSLERAMGQQHLVPITQLNPAISSHTAEAVERALGIKPDERFLTALEFAETLKATPENMSAASASAAPVPVKLSNATPKPMPATPTVIQTPPLPPSDATLRPPVAPTPTAPTTSPVMWIFGALIVLAVLGLGGILAMLFLSQPTTTPPTATIPVTAALASSTPNLEVTATSAPILPSETSAPVVTLEPSLTPTDAATETPAPTSTPAATPRGGGLGQIAYARSEGPSVPQIYLMNADGTDQHVITNLPDGACQPFWSPDGSRLAFITPCSRKTTQYDRASIYVINPDNPGEQPQPLIFMVGGVFDGDWHENDIIFTHLENGSPRIYKVAADGLDPQRISLARAADSQGSWAPDGERIAYMNTSSNGQATIFWMFKDGTFGGSIPDQITRDLSATLPKWSPRGDLITFLVNQHIYVIKWDAKGFGPLQLTTAGPNDTPKWSPDGRWITFESWRDAANHDIYIMTAEGGQQTRLTTDEATEFHPAWRP